MKNIRANVLLTTLIAVALSGCKDDAAISSLTCAELQKSADPDRQAEFVKRCPRGTGEFKPSPVKNW